MENLNGHNTPLVILAFLQADCRNSEYRRELISLGSELNQTKDINSNGPCILSPEDEGLECDGHFQSNIRDSLQDLQPFAELQWPRDHAEAAAVRRIAEDLREVAAQLEHNVVVRATQNLRSNIQASPFEQWKHHLATEVQRVMRRGVGLEHLPQERVALALTLTLVKGVCESAPRLLRGLFNTALQYIR